MAQIPAAISICERTHPPKISPAGLASAGIANVRKVNSPKGLIFSKNLAKGLNFHVSKNNKIYKTLVLVLQQGCSKPIKFSAFNSSCWINDAIDILLKQGFDKCRQP